VLAACSATLQGYPTVPRCNGIILTLAVTRTEFVIEVIADLHACGQLGWMLAGLGPGEARGRPWFGRGPQSRMEDMSGRVIRACYGDAARMASDAKKYRVEAWQQKKARSQAQASDCWDGSGSCCARAPRHHGGLWWAAQRHCWVGQTRSTKAPVHG
jgi:hypothetical protein